MSLDTDERLASFQEQRPLLFSIAYRLLGSVGEAEDAVQEAWIRWSAQADAPRNTRAFLSTVVTRICLDVLRSARARRESYVGSWLPEPLPTQARPDAAVDPESAVDLLESVSVASLLLLERLSPLERAVFVLHEVFEFGYDDVAAAVERSEAACRQLAARARRHMRGGAPRFHPTPAERAALTERFIEALREGEVQRLAALLLSEVELINDSEGRGGVSGAFAAEKAARLLAAGLAPLKALGVSLVPRELNGLPGFVLTDATGRVYAALTLVPGEGGRVAQVCTVLAPAKLGHLGPVGDLEALAAEAKRVRTAERQALRRTALQEGTGRAASGTDQG